MPLTAAQETALKTYDNLKSYLENTVKPRLSFRLNFVDCIQISMLGFHAALNIVGPPKEGEK